MPANPKYVILVIDESDNEYEFEKATNIAWERYENNVGKCRFTIPHSDDKLATDLFENGKTKIYFYRDTELVWQGLTAAVQDNIDGTTVFGLDYMECLKWGRVGFDITYSNKRIGDQLLTPIWNGITGDSNTAMGSLFTKGTVENPYDTGTSNAKTITRTVYDEDFFTFLTEMVYVSRANSPSGAWTQNTAFDITLSESSPQFRFRRDVGSDKEDVVFELNSEIVNFAKVTDFRFIRNDFIGRTIVSGPKILDSTQTDATSMSTHYRREVSPVYKNLTAQSELDERTKDNLKTNKDLKKQFSLSFSAGLAPFDGYSMGDGVKVIISRGRIDIDEYMRVIGMEVEVDDAGVEITKPLVQRKRS